MDADVERFFKGLGARRIVTLLLIVLLLSVRSILNLILLTFILTFLIDRLHTFIYSRLRKYVRIDFRVTVILLYAALLSILGREPITFAQGDRPDQPIGQNNYQVL